MGAAINERSARATTALLAIGLVVCAVVWLGLSARLAHAAMVKKTGADIRALVDAGEPVVLQGVEVVDALDLRNARIGQPFECIGCMFDGPVQAADAIFGRTVDLSGSTFVGDVDMARAVFAGPAVFGSPTEGTATFDHGADFTLATFQDLASFPSVSFKSDAHFALARFRGDAVFAEARFWRAADFGSAAFGGIARFDAQGAVAFFLGDATFDRATFAGESDFRGRLICGQSSFMLVNFGGRAEFNDTRFNGAAGFRDAHFAADGVFRNAQFFGFDSGRGANFDHAQATGSLDFTAAQFGREMDFYPQTVAGALMLTHVDFERLPGGVKACVVLRRTRDRRKSQAAAPNRKPKPSPIVVNVSGLRTPGFVMDLGAIDRHIAHDGREEALSLIEAGAKTRGDLGLANEAHYRLESLKARSHSWPVQIADVFFYGLVAGYLVEPLQPLLALLALVFLLSVLRALFVKSASSGTKPPPAQARRGRSWRGTLVRIARIVRRPRALRRLIGPWLLRLCHELLDALALILPGGGAPQGGRRFEAFAYRILFVCMAIGVANSNPTLRQMLDALF